MITRRSLLLGSLAAGLAPAIITTPGLLMPVRTLWVPGGGTFNLCTGDSFRVHAGGYRRARIVENDGLVRYAMIREDGIAMFEAHRATTIRRWEVAA